MVIRFLPNWERMDEHSENFKRNGKYKKVPNRSHRIEEHDN